MSTSKQTGDVYESELRNQLENDVSVVAGNVSDAVVSVCTLFAYIGEYANVHFRPVTCRSYRERNHTLTQLRTVKSGQFQTSGKMEIPLEFAVFGANNEKCG